MLLYEDTIVVDQTFDPIKVLINSSKKVNQFMNILDLIPGKVYMKSGDKIINGRSIMSVMTLDIMKPVYIFLEDTGSVKLLEHLVYINLAR